MVRFPRKCVCSHGKKSSFNTTNLQCLSSIFKSVISVTSFNFFHLGKKSVYKAHPNYRCRSAGKQSCKFSPFDGKKLNRKEDWILQNFIIFQFLFFVTNYNSSMKDGLRNAVSSFMVLEFQWGFNWDSCLFGKIISEWQNSTFG